MASANQVRKTFLDFFKKNGHEVVPSSSLVPQNDPTLMFTNSGMVQFKNLFTGQETRPYKRATTAQKCVRAGGKHNDLDNVGFTARHHTFFEMLGNFSFGDYFKEAAIPYAWDLLTKDFGFAKERLLVTVYHDDDEAAAIWKKVTGFSDDKIIRIPTMDNFWMMGDTGPCGPCSEIFFDHGDKIPGGPPGSPDLLKIAGKEQLEGLMFVTANWPSKSSLELADRFKKVTGEPWMPQDSISNYGHVWILKEAMEAAGSCDKAKVSESLHKIDMKTGPATLFPGGRIKFDEKGRRVDSDIVVVQWQDGEPRLIYPADVAAAPVKWAKP